MGNAQILLNDLSISISHAEKLISSLISSGLIEQSFLDSEDEGVKNALRGVGGTGAVMKGVLTVRDRSTLTCPLSLAASLFVIPITKAKTTPRLVLNNSSTR